MPGVNIFTDPARPLQFNKGDFWIDPNTGDVQIASGSPRPGFFSSLRSALSSVGIGYRTGAGGTVTQATNKQTGVTLNRPCGQITMNNEALAAGAETSFTVTNSLIEAGDVVVAIHGSAGAQGSYLVNACEIVAGSFDVTVSNVSAGSLSEAIVINFVLIKGATA